MRVILQVTAGPQAGRKVLLGPHRELKIGRSEWAELVCDGDVKMSRVHCQVETNAFGCSVSDLGSSNGTFINDQQITEKTVLREGDTLRAGSTLFKVQIEGDSPAEAETINQQHAAAVRALKESRKSAADLAERKAVLDGEKKLAYRSERASTGCYFFSPAEPPGKRAAAEAARLALLLREVIPAQVLVYPLNAPELDIADFLSAEVLFDWLPEEVQRQRSPLLVAAETIADLPQLFDNAWGKNALVILLTTDSTTDTLATLRNAIRPSDTESLLGLCWPKVLHSLLQGDEGNHYFAQLGEVQAVLLEDAGADNAWKLVAEEGFLDVLDGIGLVEASAGASN